MKKGIILFFLVFLGQVFPLSAQFILNSSASQISDSCFQLTPAELFQTGSIWFEEKIDLNESFDVLMDLYFGCLDSDGADGIVFGFQPVGTSVGLPGEGIGIQNVSPSFAVEFDTWENPFDPPEDHIMIFRDGQNTVPSGTLAGPVPAAADASNIEDCEFHQMRATWDASSQTFTVYFDCEERLTYTGDIVNDIFNGDPEVFWGFTSATGGAVNIHQVCFTYTSFLDGFEDVVICPGGAFQLNLSGGDSYLWTPSEGLDNPNIPNPLATPTETTTYVVDVLDECGVPFTDTITVFVDGDTVRFDLGPDTLICRPDILTLDAENGSPATYVWNDGETNPVRQALTTGFYSVTATLDDYCLTQGDIFVEYQSPPEATFSSDTILCREQTTVLSAALSGSAADYLWSTGETEAEIEVRVGGNYSVSVTNTCGEIEGSITVEETDCNSLYTPNVFSPNFDGVNDFFQLYSDGDVTEVTMFQIYDRWGNLLFETSGTVENLSDFSWDGFHAGQAMPAGVYVWYAELLFRDGKSILTKGDVLLLK